MNPDLFSDLPTPRWTETLAPGAVVLRGFVADQASQLLATLAVLTRESPFRQMVTPGGHTLSVAMSNCGRLGWISDESGYCYTPVDPLTGAVWPEMPRLFAQLAQQAADAAGFAAFEPDACLINRYQVGARMSLHQDKNERDFTQPIVSLSLGLPAMFQFGGMRREDPVQRISLSQGDVLVWGGESRLRYHGVLALKAGLDTQAVRLNLTFRKAG